MMIYQFDRFCKMIPIGYYYFRAIGFYRNYHRFTVGQRVNLFPVDNGPYLQETQKSVVLPCNDYIVFGGDNF